MTDDLRNLITFWEREEQEVLAKIETFGDANNGQLMIARLVLSTLLSMLQEIRDKGPGV